MSGSTMKRMIMVLMCYMVGQKSDAVTAEASSRGLAAEASSSDQAGEASSSDQAAEASSSDQAAEASSSDQAAEASSRDLAAEASSSDHAARLERLEAIYERNIQKLEAQLQKQNEIINKQAEFMAGQADRLQKQAASITAQSDRTDGLELENQKQTKLNAEQTEMIRDLRLENQKQARVIAEQSERIGCIELEQNQQDNIVAFTASASVTRVYNAGDRVLFDSVLTNYGDSYDSVTSIFTCSVSGYYLFSVTVMTDKDGAMRAQIQLDDTLLVSAYSTDWETGSNLVVTFCGAGQAVWVMCQQGQGEVMYGGGRWSTFSGMLLTMG